MSVLDSLRQIIIITFNALPLLLITFIGFLGLTLGNIGILFLLLGHVTIVPVITFAGQNLIRVPAVDQTHSSLVASDPITGDAYPIGNNVPTFWLANVIFFLGYILGNAYNAYQLTSKLSNLPGNSWYVDAQKTRSLTVMLMSVGLIVATCIARSYTGFEANVGSIIGTALIFTIAGSLWYWVASLCGARYADIFGMATQPTVAFDDKQKPTTCVYTPKS